MGYEHVLSYSDFPMIIVGATVYPTPTQYNGTTSTFVDAARNVLGVTVGQIIREDVGKVDATWSFLTPEALSQMLKCWDSQHGGNFYSMVRFLNQVTNSFEARLMYVSDRTAGVMSQDPATGKVLGYTNIRMAMVEV
jgi:hypothetical protein